MRMLDRMCTGIESFRSYSRFRRLGEFTTSARSELVVDVFQVVQLLSTSGAGLISAQSIGEAVITAAAQGSLKAGGRSSTVMAVMDDIQVR